MEFEKEHPIYCHFHCFYRIGLIEWLENTCTLKEFLFSTATNGEKERAARYSTLYTIHCEYLVAPVLSNNTEISS